MVVEAPKVAPKPGEVGKGGGARLLGLDEIKSKAAMNSPCKKAPFLSRILVE